MSVYGNFSVDLDNSNSSWTIVYNLIKKDKKILDIGCSSGYFDDVLIKQKQCIVDGIELDVNDANKAAKICRKVICGNVESENFNWDNLDTNYDYIILIDVVEHLVNPSEVLKKISSLLSPDGRIIISVPNMANGTVRLQLIQGNFDYEKEGLLDSTHLHYYTASELQKVIDKAGLRIKSVDYTSYYVTKEIVEDIFEKVGLELSEKFYKYITSGEALVYQYIVEISNIGKTKKISNNINAIKPKLEYENQLLQIQDDARRLFNEKIIKDKQINEMQIMLDKQGNELIKLNKYNLLYRLRKVIKRHINK